MEESVVLFKVLSVIGVGLSGLGSVWSVWFWYDKKQKDDAFDALKNRVDSIRTQQTEHANRFITEHRSREIIKEEIAPLRDDVLFIKNSMTEIRDSVNSLVTELAIHNAVQNALKEQNKS